eukprot:SAG31_NODE_2126_length_6395_cov_3.289708_6_plen_59_part_01
MTHSCKVNLVLVLHLGEDRGHARRHADIPYFKIIVLCSHLPARMQSPPPQNVVTFPPYG